MISDGIPVKENLKRRGIDDGELRRILKKHGVCEEKNVFLLYETGGVYTCIPKERRNGWGA